MVMPMPALEKVMPTLCGTSTSRSMLSPQEDISRNMSSTPMPAPPGKRVGQIKTCGSERSRDGRFRVCVGYAAVIGGHCHTAVLLYGQFFSRGFRACV